MNTPLLNEEKETKVLKTKTQCLHDFLSHYSNTIECEVQQGTVKMSIAWGCNTNKTYKITVYDRDTDESDAMENAATTALIIMYKMMGK